MPTDDTTLRRPTTVGETMRRALQAFRVLDDGEVERLCRLVLGAVPDHAGALKLLGVTRLRQKRNAEAIGLLERALARQPANADIMHNLGRAFDALGRHEQALAQFDRALAISPTNAWIMYRRGLALLRLDRCEEAADSLERALERRPEFPEALNVLGTALGALRRHDAAIEKFRAALALRPEYPEAFCNLGNALNDSRRHAEALEPLARAAELAPLLPEAWNNRGIALMASNRLAEALACYEQALTLRPNWPDCEVNQGTCRLRMGDFARGFRGIEARWRKDDFLKIKRNFPQPQWMGEPASEGRTILLHADQGFGDTIQLVRLASRTAARNARVILEVQPALKALMQGVDGVTQVYARGDTLPAFDWHCPLLSLPLALGLTLETIPAPQAYLRAPPQRIAKWTRRLGPPGAFRVAIAWAGNSRHRKQSDERPIPAASFATLLATPGIEWLGLQKDATREDLAALGRVAPVRNFGDELTDFADTAAIMCLADLVVSVDTSIAHLAGALGRPGCILLPFAADWRWMPEARESRWYPSLRLFRQPTPGDWGSVLARVSEELARVVTAR